MAVSLAFCTDCMRYMRNVPTGYFDLAIVDPPYGLGETWKKSTKGRRYGKFPATTYTNAAVPDADYFRELKRVAKDWIIWGYNYFTEILGSTNYLIVWDKVAGNNNAIRYSRCEIACTSVHIPCNIVRVEWDGCRTGSERGVIKIHPHQKPVALYEWLLRNYAKSGDRIFDSHLGSGSSRIAAYDLGFDFVGCEIDPTYYERQERRFAAHIAQLKIEF